MTRRIRFLTLCLLGTACLAPLAQAADAQDRSAVSRPGAAIGDFGLDLTARKPSVKPGDDFFSFANGQR